MITLKNTDLFDLRPNRPQPPLIHPKAIVEGIKIGVGTRIWAFAHVLGGAVIGNQCNICDHTFIENDVVIGDRVTIKSGVYVWDGVRIEDDAFIGPNVSFTNDRRPRSGRQPARYVGATVRRGASIGAGAILLPGVEVGEYAMVGAGAVVTRPIPPHALVVGNPAQEVGHVCRCGERVDDEAAPYLCSQCRAEEKFRELAA